MKVAILSGKGGVGKTLLSVNLAAVDKNATYIDCDVEEPNGHLFFKPQGIIKTDVAVKMPMIDNDRCSGCRSCVAFCNFNAMAYIGGKVKVFEDVCHSCGGCALVCPENAITEYDKVIGHIEAGESEDTKVCSGILNVGEISGVPIIDQLNDIAKKTQNNTYIDCPPGSACVVMESIKEADYCVIVAEPTIFGAHNMEMVHELVTNFKKPVSVVINKVLLEENPVREFCEKKHVPIIGEILFDHELGSINSDGEIVVRQNEKYRKIFSDILKQLQREVGYEAIINT